MKERNKSFRLTYVKRIVMIEETMFSSDRDDVILSDIHCHISGFKEKIQEGRNKEAKGLIKDIIYLYEQLSSKDKIKLLPFDLYVMMRVLIDTIAEVAAASETIA